MDTAYNDKYVDMSCIITRAFLLEAEKISFSEEDIERILGPLKKRIMAGEFTRTRRAKKHRDYRHAHSDS
jgi:hypothetical protein